MLFCCEAPELFVDTLCREWLLVKFKLGPLILLCHGGNVHFRSFRVPECSVFAVRSIVVAAIFSAELQSCLVMTSEIV